MDHNVWIPLLSAFAGALIGSLTTIAAIFIQAHFQNKREHWHSIIEASLHDHKQGLEAAKLSQNRRLLSPLVAYIYYNSKVITLLSKDQLSKESLEKLGKEMDQIHDVFRKKNENASNALS